MWRKNCLCLTLHPLFQCVLSMKQQHLLMLASWKKLKCRQIKQAANFQKLMLELPSSVSVTTALGQIYTTGRRRLRFIDIRPASLDLCLHSSVSSPVSPFQCLQSRVSSPVSPVPCVQSPVSSPVPPVPCLQSWFSNVLRDPGVDVSADTCLTTGAGSLACHLCLWFWRPLFISASCCKFNTLQH
jgi:hypothetical protein